MLDIHIIRHPDGRDTLERAVESIPDWANLHLVGGERGHIGNGRRKGLSAGSCDYVGFIDDDDYLEEGAAQLCLSFLERNQEFDAVTTGETLHFNNETLKTVHGERELHCKELFLIHHFCVMRRAAVAPFIESLSRCPQHSEHTLWAQMLMNGSRFYHLSKPLYHYFIHSGGSLQNFSELNDFSRQIFAALGDKVRSDARLAPTRHTHQH